MADLGPAGRPVEAPQVGLPDPGPQRRTMITLLCTQVTAGVGLAVGIAVSSLIAAGMSGSDVVGGAAQTCTVIGAALASYLLSRVAQRSGRRPALSLGYGLGTLGALGAALAVALDSWPALLVAMLPFGAGVAAGLSARFAATDLARPDRVARSLSLVIWATTIGAVAGPNLAEPAQRWAGDLGLVAATGPYLLSAAAFALATAGATVGLRPDPLLLARSRSALADTSRGAAGDKNGGATAGPERSPWQVLAATPAAQLAVAAIVLCHLVMVGIMSLTPVHMNHAGASLRLVGLVISLHIAGMYALSPVFGWLADRFGRRSVLALGAGFLVVAGIVAGTSGGADTTQLSIGLIALGLGWSAGLVAGSALITDSVSIVDRPGVQGLSDVAMNTAGALGGVLAGVTLALSSYTVLGLAAAVLALPFLLIVAMAAVRAPTRG